MTTHEHFAGSIIGLAIGDALGRPTEFVGTLADLRAQFGPDGLTDFLPDAHPAGTYTDDTQMTLAVAKALIHAGHKSLDELMSFMAAEFIVWCNSPDNDRAPGNTCLIGCRNMERGVPWRTAGVPGSKGCGSAMRTAPIGLYYYDDEKKLIEVSHASSLATHGHPTALAAAAATALLTAWALHGDDPSHYPARLAKSMRNMEGAEVAQLVELIPSLLDRNPDDVLREGVLGTAWTGESAVASALYCFCRSPRDFRSTVLTGANTVGDSDSIACIAGAISGAFNGLNAIPEKWRREVESGAMLHKVANELFEAG